MTKISVKQMREGVLRHAADGNNINHHARKIKSLNQT